MLSRAGICDEIRRLRSLVDGVSPKITLIGEQINGLVKETARIRSLADRKAASFRESYEEAQSARESGDREEANEWSESGQEKEEACRVLNNQVRVLCVRHQELCRIHQGAVNFVKTARSRMYVLSTRAERTRIAIGDPNRLGTYFKNPNLVREALDQFPPAVTALIGRVERISSGQPTVTVSGSYQTGKTWYDDEAGRYVLSSVESIGLPGDSYDKNKLNLFRNIFHEVGHIFWDRFVSDGEKQIWEQIFTNGSRNPPVSEYAKRSTSPQEDFCETLAYHFSKDKVPDLQRVNLIESITSRVDTDLNSQMGLQAPNLTSSSHDSVITH